MKTHPEFRSRDLWNFKFRIKSPGRVKPPVQSSCARPGDTVGREKCHWPQTAHRSQSGARAVIGSAQGPDRCLTRSIVTEVA